MKITLIDWLFPRFCLNCGKLEAYLCDDCRFLIRPLVAQICPVCQQLSFSGKTHKYCYQRESLNGLISLFTYRGIVKKAIIKLKYRFVTDLAGELADLVLTNFPFKLLPQDFILVPIPLHPYRFNWRGFNQSALLAQKISNLVDCDLRLGLLKKAKNTLPQVGLKGDQRQANLKDSFIVDKRELESLNNLKKPLVLFDDVWTTGATLKAAGKILKDLGFKKVWGLTICR